MSDLMTAGGGTDWHQHWATLEGDELCAAMLEQYHRFEANLLRSGDLGRMIDMSLAYHGEDKEGHSDARTDATGDKGQLRVLKANHLRSVIQAKLTLATAEPPGLLPVPTNSDSQSLIQAQLARGLVEYYLEDLKGYEEAYDAAEMAECLGWAWVDVPWDASLGGKLGTVPTATDDMGNVAATRTVTEGDVAFRARMPVDVAFDYQRRGKHLDWVIIRDYRNKFDLAAEVESGAVQAQVPGDSPQEIAEQIRSLKHEEDVRQRLLFGRRDSFITSDDIPVYELRHRHTAAVQGGRKATLVGQRLLLGSGPNPYAGPDGSVDDLAVYRINAARRYGTARGYTSAHGTLGLQIAVDTLTGIPYSNQRALGGNVIVALEGSDLRAEKLKQGLSVVYTKNPNFVPQVLQLLRTAPEMFSFRKELIGEMGNMEGLDQLSLGRDERQLSGAAMALLDSRTQRSVSGLARAYVALLVDMANAVVRRHRMFGRTTRKVATLVGKANRPKLMSFGPDDLAGVDRVRAETVSPLMRVPSGRLEVAKDLLAAKAQNGAPLINGEQYMAVVQTGRLEPLTEGPMAEIANIRSENERLAAGEALETPPQVDPATGQPRPAAGPKTAVMTDHHKNHVMEHRAVLASPEARGDAAIVANTLAHIQAHIDLWRSADPALLALLEIPPPPPPPMPPMPPQGGPPMMGPGGVPPAPGPGPGGQPHGPPAPVPGKSSGMPNMPTNPSNGAKWSPTGDISNG